MKSLASLVIFILLGCTSTSLKEGRKISSITEVAIDHIIYAGPDLQKLGDVFNGLSEVTPVYGGGHPELGTHNSIASLGEKKYIELISPDPSNKIDGGVTVLGIGDVKKPKIVGWAMNTNNLEALRSQLQSSGFIPSRIYEGSRKKPDGEILEYKTLFIEDEEFQESLAIAPFFIEWISQHPSKQAPEGCSIINWSANHPEPSKYEKLFKSLNFDFPIEKSSRADFELRLSCKTGEFTIR